MQKPLQITLRGMDHSEAVEQRIRDKVASLERFAHRITSCHVTVESPHQRHRQGNAFAVHVTIQLPDKQLVFGSHGNHQAAHEDVYAAIRDAFAAAARGLEHYQGERSHH